MVTTILVSDAEKKLLEEAQDEILHFGLSSLDPTTLEELKHANIEVSKFTRGTVVAIGAACIISRIKQKKRS